MTRSEARSPRELLDLHLATWLGGAWPPDGDLVVTASPARCEAGWDGSALPFLGIRSPMGTVLSVPPDLLERSIELVEAGGLEALGQGFADYLPFPAPRLVAAEFRWCEQPPASPDVGEWADPRDPATPPWVRSYQEALVVWDPECPGGCAGAVGVKHHDPYGHELAIEIAPQQRSRGLGRHLVAQAARKVLSDGAVPTGILHAHNVASRRMSSAAGLLDRGWQCLAMAAGPAPNGDPGALPTA